MQRANRVDNGDDKEDHLHEPKHRVEDGCSFFSYPPWASHVREDPESPSPMSAIVLRRLFCSEARFSDCMEGTGCAVCGDEAKIVMKGSTRQGEGGP